MLCALAADCLQSVCCVLPLSTVCCLSQPAAGHHWKTMNLEPNFAQKSTFSALISLTLSGSTCSECPQRSPPSRAGEIRSNFAPPTANYPPLLGASLGSLHKLAAGRLGAPGPPLGAEQLRIKARPAVCPAGSLAVLQTSPKSHLARRAIGLVVLVIQWAESQERKERKIPQLFWQSISIRLCPARPCFLSPLDLDLGRETWDETREKGHQFVDSALIAALSPDAL